MHKKKVNWFLVLCEIEKYPFVYSISKLDRLLPQEVVAGLFFCKNTYIPATIRYPFLVFHFHFPKKAFPYYYLCAVFKNG